MEYKHYDLSVSSTSLIRQRYNVWVRSVATKQELKVGDKLHLYNATGVPPQEIEAIRKRVDGTPVLVLLDLGADCVPVMALPDYTEADDNE